jgi:hypothetical protein
MASMTDQNGLAEPSGKQEHHSTDVRQLVEQAVAQALHAQIPQLQAHIAQGVLASLPRENSAAASAHPGPAALVHAVASIHAGSTQKEVLRGLLDAGSQYCARIALFVVKAGTASGWQSRGLVGYREGEPIKDFPLDLINGPAAHAFHNRVCTPGNIAEMGGEFVRHLGAPRDEQILVLPLSLKEKVAALVYADGGDTGKLESSALELLVMATSSWLEVISLRKQAAPRDDADAAYAPLPVASPALAPAAPPVQTVSSFSDPFASHAPMHIPPAPAPLPSAPAAVAHAGAAAAPAVATDPLAGLSPEDADTHRKAQRFAKLLVDEIKLYNQAKVTEGRRNKNLYDVLKEDIDKSRGTFQKRYGNTVAASVDYFHQELMRSLAEDNITIMGTNFRP